jgi:uncharacterized membrane protein YagU involved in acid resistance
METSARTRQARSWTPAQALIIGGLTVGLLDGLEAIVFFGLRGVTPTQIMQSIASGLLGRAAYQGGIATAALGTLLHFGIALAVVVTYYVASRRWPALTRQPLVFGPLYGVVVYAVMNFVVLPLSAAVTGTRTLPVVINGLLIHALGVGLPSAVFARAATRAKNEDRGAAIRG